MIKYILEGKQVKQVDDLLKWAKWFNKANRTVDKTRIAHVLISTVFLGIDRSLGVGTPLLFETMIFGGNYDGYHDRYATWGEAMKGHQSACEKVAALN